MKYLMDFNLPNAFAQSTYGARPSTSSFSIPGRQPKNENKFAVFDAHERVCNFHFADGRWEPVQNICGLL